MAIPKLFEPIWTFRLLLSNPICNDDGHSPKFLFFIGENKMKEFRICFKNMGINNQDWILGFHELDYLIFRQILISWGFGLGMYVEIWLF